VKVIVEPPSSSSTPYHFAILSSQASFAGIELSFQDISFTNSSSIFLINGNASVSITKSCFDRISSSEGNGLFINSPEYEGCGILLFVDSCLFTNITVEAAEFGGVVFLEKTSQPVCVGPNVSCLNGVICLFDELEVFVRSFVCVYSFIFECLMFEWRDLFV
jgi:hypothetical protein